MFFKTVLFSGWLGLVGVAFQSANQPLQVESNGTTPIAALQDVKGDVQVRPVGFELWTEGANGQSLVKGNIVATGEDATTAIEFLDGRSIILEPNTQLSLSEENQSETDSNTVVTLLKGTFDLQLKKQAVATRGAPRKLQVKSGTKTINVGTEPTEFKISRSNVKTSASLTVKQGNVTVVDEKTKKSTAVDATQKAVRLRMKMPELKSVVPVDLSQLSAAVVPKATSIERISTKLPQTTIPERVKLEIPEPKFLKLASLTPIDDASKDAAKVRPVEKEIEKAKPEPVPVIETKLQLSQPNLSFPSGKTNFFFTRDSIANGDAPSFAMNILGKGVANSKYFVRLASRGWLRTTGTRNRQYIPLRSNMIQKYGRKQSVSGVPSWEVKLQPGQSLGNQSSSGKNRVVRFASIADLPSGAWSVSLNGLKETSERGWFSVPGNVTTSTAELTIWLRDTAGLQRLGGFIEGADDFSLAQSTSIPSRGIFLIKNRSIYGQMSGPKAVKPSVIKGLSRKVGAQVAFAGYASDLLNPGDLKELSEAQKTIYVYRNGKFHKVNPDLIKSEPLAVDFLMRNGEAFFKRPVKIVDWEI